MTLLFTVIVTFFAGMGAGLWVPDSAPALRA